MVPNTSDDLPDPETPVNTVNRRLGISTLTSFRLFSRAPWTRIRSWLSARCSLGEAMLAIISCSRPEPRLDVDVGRPRLPEANVDVGLEGVFSAVPRGTT